MVNRKKKKKKYIYNIYIYIMNKSNNCYNISGPTSGIICISTIVVEAWSVVEDDG
jgi:hypothetical protein